MPTKPERFRETMRSALFNWKAVPTYEEADALIEMALENVPNRREFYHSISLLNGITGWTDAGLLLGKSARLYEAQRPLIQYAVVSRYTPIAWWTPGGWTVVLDSLGTRTSLHQELVKYVLQDDYWTVQRTPPSGLAG